MRARSLSSAMAHTIGGATGDQAGHRRPIGRSVDGHGNFARGAAAVHSLHSAGAALRENVPMPIDPGPSRFDFADLDFGDDDFVAAGGDLAPSTLLAAYRHGLFPMPLADESGAERPSCHRTGIGWWSPLRRGVLRPHELRVSGSLRKSVRRYRTSVDRAFADVVAGCADPSRPHGWIDDEIAAAYLTLHRLGWAHSVEAWDDDGLAGGLYGVRIGALFAGESMFHRRRDASKVALVRLCGLLGPGSVVDTQWLTPHLASLGAGEMERADYLALLPRLIADR